MNVAEITDLLSDNVCQARGEAMETQTINWLDLSESEKANFLEQTRTYLKQQIAEAKLSKNASAILQKYDII